MCPTFSHVPHVHCISVVFLIRQIRVWTKHYPPLNWYLCFEYCLPLPCELCLVFEADIPGDVFLPLLSFRFI